MINNTFWKNKNILITGINGFVGSNLAKYFISLGANVFGISKKIIDNSLLDYENLSQNVNFNLISLCDYEVVCSFFKTNQIDVCFHLAAQVEVGVANKNPLSTWETNVRGTYNLLESIRLFNPNIKAIIVASSDKAYGSYDESEMPYKEEYPLKPQYPYDTSKACADLIARSYASDIYQLPIAITRFANIYGPGQLNFSALFPDCIRSALGYSKFIPRGDGSHIRDFLFIDDVISLYSLISSKLIHESKSITGQVFNAGTNEPRAVKDIINIIYNKIGNIDDLSQVNMQLNNNTTIGEIDCQYMDYDKVNNFFNWKPETPFDLGIDKTIKWYDSYLKKIYIK